MRLFVTGFGPFLEFSENPSAWLAENSGAPFEILDVTFQAVDDFLGRLDPEAFDALLMIGLAGKAEKMRIERVGRNAIGSIPDAGGVQQGPAPIDPTAPVQLSANIWREETEFLDPERLEDSVDAGDYLCNYALYRSIQRFPEKRIGFLHVPLIAAIPLEDQLETLQQLIESITSTED